MKNKRNLREVGQNLAAAQHNIYAFWCKKGKNKQKEAGLAQILKDNEIVDKPMLDGKIM